MAISRLSGRRRRGFTLTEIIIASSITAMVSIPLMGTFMFILRAQLTSANIVFVRERAAQVVERFEQDVRNSSSSAYNSGGWPRVVTANPTKVNLMDAVTGSHIVWQWSSTTKRLTRTVHQIQPGGTFQTTAETFRTEFPDLMFQEVTQNDTDPSNAVVTTITGIRIVTRVFLTMNHQFTTVKEVDGNNDGDYGNDRVRKEIFGKTTISPVDNPGWQHLINIRTTFRNT